MSRRFRWIGTATLLWIVSTPGCGSNHSSSDPGQALGRPSAVSAVVAPVGPTNGGPEAPGQTGNPKGSPPSVSITSPRPSSLLIAHVPQHTTVTWTSVDPDGPGPGPKTYFFKILSEHDTEFPFLVALVDPDSLRRFYSPDFPGWTQVKGSVESFTLPDLDFNTRYMFVVTAVDRRGNEDPVFSTNKNMLMFNVEFAPPAAEAAGTDGAAERRNGRSGGH